MSHWDMDDDDCGHPLDQFNWDKNLVSNLPTSTIKWDHVPANIQFDNCHPLDHPAYYAFGFESKYSDMKNLRIKYLDVIAKNKELADIKQEYDKLNGMYQVFETLQSDT